MSQRTNRAFYSEPLISFPGRLHITAEKICVEVLVIEDGKRKFRSYTPEEFEELKDILCKQDFYSESFDDAYRKELFDITLRARHIQSVLFNNDRTTNESSSFIREASGIPPEVKITESFDEGLGKRDTDTTNLLEDEKEAILGDVVSNLIEHSSTNIPSIESFELSQEENIEETPLFEQFELVETEVPEVPDEKVDSITSKYIGKFANLHVKKENGKFAPDKAILLMSVISLYDGGKPHGVIIHGDEELLDIYKSKWNKYFPGTSAANIKDTFRSMNDESFWHLFPANKKEELSAKIDPELAAILNQRNSRSLLRKTLHNRYLK